MKDDLNDWTGKLRPHVPDLVIFLDRAFDLFIAVRVLRAALQRKGCLLNQSFHKYETIMNTAYIMHRLLINLSSFDKP